MTEKSIDRVRVYASKKNVRAVCAAIEEGCTVVEAAWWILQ